MCGSWRMSGDVRGWVGVRCTEGCGGDVCGGDVGMCGGGGCAGVGDVWGWGMCGFGG